MVEWTTGCDYLPLYHVDRELNFSVGSESWENESVCYPCVVDVNGKRYLFYNGNQNGKTGFGVAVLEDKQ